MSDGEKNIRPYFIPAEIDFQRLPKEVQVVLTAKIQPMYLEMVLDAHDSLASSAGMSHVFLACLEVLEQFQLAQAEFEGIASGGSDPAERQSRREPYFRLQAAKSKSTSAMQRIIEMRKSKPVDPFVRPPS